MSVTAGAIILGSAILGAVGGSVGSIMAYDGVNSDRGEQAVSQGSFAKRNEQQVIIGQNRYPSYTVHPCISYDANGVMQYYYKENGCY